MKNNIPKIGTIWERMGLEMIRIRVISRCDDQITVAWVDLSSETYGSPFTVTEKHIYGSYRRVR